MKPKIPAQRDIRNLLLNIFGFLLLWEWLRPLHTVTDTQETSGFVIFVGVCFLLLFLRVPFLLGALIKIFLMLYMVHSLYFKQDFLNVTWLKGFAADFIKNIGLMLQANWMGMTPIFRTLLFCILLWLMSYLLHYWFTHQKRILLFFVLTIIYITVIDTFSPYNAQAAIIRTVLIGFFMLGILQFERLKDKELSKHVNIGKKWAIPLAIFILFSAFIGYISPKASPQWPDPVPFLKGYGQENANGSINGVKKIGYGTNDQSLGGPFIADDTVVFNANTEKRHYWRVETKDTYTGKGWKLSGEAEKEIFYDENTALNWYETKTEVEEFETEIQMDLKYSHIVYPLGLSSVEADPDIHFSVNTLSEKVSTYRGNDEVKLDSYSLHYEYPKYYINHLKEVTEPGSLEQDAIFRERYTQLPVDLPERVKELAAEITSSLTNRYDQVKAVENYFQVNGFVYDTQDVAIPEGDQDYVDQFLFDTKMGYCDNFSTSMVVLLRAADIPSRWVKGYTEGQRIELNSYEITNNNAHSWVEVYFPEFGWVPFEPTKGFSNSNLFSYDLTMTGSGNSQTPQTAPDEIPKEEKVEEAVATPISEDTDSSIFEKITKAFSWKYVLIILVSIFLIVYTLFKSRKKWLPYLYIRLYKNAKDEDVYFKAYHALLKQLDRVGFPRKEGQTLREYSLQVDHFYKGHEMEQLTRSYERALYRKDNAHTEWVKSVELWENLIKKISS
ncbi:transglutaminaseTgpA domain-containing protein [Bacillus sp. REN16]|uniref:transglutaminaseTgpA domain-containing protein n=1 Tax=Bacillus sp. REN16 TaxID=2887296 RepID=UPI001E2A3216|nr:transglutaminaseTgpA domain-containing protein [Bacillus sp. REN16]MCC3359447.1 transglutaminaseTgpA domain-containing protein [Bacillus sp. REN16]